MSDTFNQILAAADWKEITPRLLYYADTLIRRCVWRGLHVHAVAGTKVCVEGSSAEDFVQEAIDRLINGRREYQYGVSLEQNLKGIIRSSVWSLNKSARRARLVDSDSNPKSEKVSGVVDEAASTSPSPEESAISSEALIEQQCMLNNFEASLKGDGELLKVFNALKAEHHTPRAVEDFTGIPAARVSELKRKLRGRLEQFELQAVERKP